MLDIPNIIGRYEIVDRVARGGMGALYRARDPVLERDVAIKVMLADFLRDAVGRARFYREARAVARLQHRNIVTLFDFGEDEGNPYIVMEFLQGQTLAARMKHGPPVPLDEALGIGAQLCTGLHFAHAHGVVHRDVKPANIWLCDDGGVKLLDFGIAKFGDTDVTQAGDVLGSVSYMSPEQLSAGTIDGRSDIFSAGIVMFELLAGRRPFQGESPTAIMMRIIHEEAPPLDAVPGAPARLRTLIGQALEKQPGRRYQHAAEFASELRDLQLVIEARHQRADAVAKDVSVGAAPAPSSSAPPRAGQPEAVQPAAPSSQPPPAASSAPVQAGGLMIREQGSDLLGDALEADDPAGDVIIGGLAPAAPVAPDPNVTTGVRRAWIPAGAAAMVVLATVVTFLLVRGESTGVAEAPPANPNAGVSTPRAAAPSTGTGAATPDTSTGANGAPPAHGTNGSSTAPSAPPDGAKTGATTTSAASPDGAGAKPDATSTSNAPTSPTSPASNATTPPAASESTTLRVMVTGTYPFSVSGEGGGVLSRPRTSHELTLAGPQSLRLRSPEYGLDRRVSVKGTPGSTVRLTAPPLGRLTVRTLHETCQILLGASALGYPPIAERPVASGTYRLTLKCPDGDDQTSMVTIMPHQTHVALIR